MMQVSLYGRLGKDAQLIETKTGNPMCAASLAVDVSGRDGEATLWVRVLAFGKLAELLQGHAKGDTLAASGRLELSRWQGEDGTERESWQLVAVHLHSARTVRPGGKGRDGADHGPRQSPRAPAGAPTPFDDALSF